MPDELREKALRLLGRREHSRAELQRKLARYSEDRPAVEALLDDFERRGWLSEKRFAEHVLALRAGRYGSLKVGQELREKGVADALVEAAVRQAREGDLESARDVWRRKFGRLPRDGAERGRQARFLQSRGFSMDVIRQVLKGLPDE